MLKLLQKAFRDVGRAVVQPYRQFLGHDEAGPDGRVRAETRPASHDESYNGTHKCTLTGNRQKSRSFNSRNTIRGFDFAQSKRIVNDDSYANFAYSR